MNAYKKSYNEYMLSQEWRSTRINVLIRDKWRCKKCKRIGSRLVKLTVHHKYGWDPKITDKPSDLITLCNDCHTEEHDEERKPRPKKFLLKTKIFEWGKSRREFKDTVVELDESTYRKIKRK